MAPFLYGVLTYLAGFAALLYMIAFVGDLPVPRTIDGPAAGSVPVAAAVAIDVALLLVFALQHSVMARPAFKRIWTRLVPSSVERSTYVLFTAIVLALLFWQWQPIPAVAWSVDNPLGIVALKALFGAGWALVVLSTFLINHFELFGLQQVWVRLRGKTLPAPEFRTPFLYRIVRHPLYLGILLALWSTPTMTAGHLLFAAVNTLYILVGVTLEERDLVALFGDRYRTYRERVSMLLPLPKRGAAAARQVRPS